MTDQDDGVTLIEIRAYHLFHADFSFLRTLSKIIEKSANSKDMLCNGMMLCKKKDI